MFTDFRQSMEMAVPAVFKDAVKGACHPGMRMCLFNTHQNQLSSTYGHFVCSLFIATEANNCKIKAFNTIYV